MTPPAVPQSFWDSPSIRSALDDWHMGRLIKAYRHHPLHGPRPLPQELVGEWLGVTQTQLSRIENGRPITDLDRLASWARTLGIPPHLLWFKLPGRKAHRPAPDEAPSPPRISAPSLPAVAGRLALSPLSGPYAACDGDPDTVALSAFRAADRQVGGGHLYPTVTNYLRCSVAPRLLGVERSDDSGRVLVAAGGFTEMAGWMAHDAGHDNAARRHFRRSLDFARAGGHPQLSAHVYASLSHLALHMNEPREAITLARQGRAALAEAQPTPPVAARLLAMEARGLAAMKEDAACADVLGQAEQALARPLAEPPSPWISPFDEGSLASEAARCMHDLGRLNEAERQARRIMQLRAGGRVRSRAFASLLLIRVLIAQGRLDEACHLAAGVLDATQALSSNLVSRQLQEVQAELEPYRTVPAVGEFLPHLAGAVRQRLGMYGWLTGDAAD